MICSDCDGPLDSGDPLCAWCGCRVHPPLAPTFRAMGLAGGTKQMRTMRVGTAVVYAPEPELFGVMRVEQLWPGQSERVRCLVDPDDNIAPVDRRYEEFHMDELTEPAALKAA